MGLINYLWASSSKNARVCLFRNKGVRQVSDCQWGTAGSGLAVIEAVIPVIRSVESSFEVSLLLS